MDGGSEGGSGHVRPVHCNRLPRPLSTGRGHRLLTYTAFLGHNQCACDGHMTTVHTYVCKHTHTHAHTHTIVHMGRKFSGCRFTHTCCTCSIVFHFEILHLQDKYMLTSMKREKDKETVHVEVDISGWSPSPLRTTSIHHYCFIGFYL